MYIYIYIYIAGSGLGSLMTCVYTIIVGSKWGGLLRHRVVTKIRIIWGEIAPRAGFHSDLHQTFL